MGGRRVFSAALVVAVVATLLNPLTSPALAEQSPDGPVRAWGRNGSGQLGVGSAVSLPDPTTVLGLLDVAAAAAGEAHSLGLTATGEVYAWGAGDRGQLGRGADGLTGSTAPQPVHAGETSSSPSTPLTGVADLAAGARHTLILHTAGAATGRVYGFGSNSSGQVGGLVDHQRPTLIQFRLDVSDPLRPLEDVLEVAAGGNHSLALRADGAVFAFGSNSHGQLGNGVFTDTPNPVATPVPVAGFRMPVAALAAGATHSLALTSGGEVYAWGGGSRGQLGNGSTTPRVTVPVLVEGLPTIAAIAAGDRHSLAVAEDGRVFAWGANSSGQLGDGTTTDRTRPVEVLSGPGTAVSEAFAAAAGAAHTVILTGDPAQGVVHAAGANGDGQLGDGTLLPRLFAGPTAASLETAAAVAAGAGHTLAVVAPRARLDPPAIDFGELDVGAVSSPEIVTLHNDGPGPIDVTSVTIDNHIEFVVGETTCLGADGAAVTLDEGGQCTIAVAFAPAGLGTRGSGAGPATLTVETSAVDSPHQTSLTGVGIVQPGAVAITVDPPTTPASPLTVDIGKVPFFGGSPNVLLAPDVPLDGVHLAPDVPLGGVDLAPDVGLGGVDLAPDVGLGGVDLAPEVPLGGVDLAPDVGLGGVDLAPAAAAVLDSISLAQMPLKAGLSWYDLVPGLGPLHETSVGDVLRLDPRPDGVANLTLGDIDLPSTPLRQVSDLAWALGDTPLGAYPLAAADVCAALEEQGHTDCGADLTREGYPDAKGLGSSLLAAEIAGAELDALHLDALPASGFDLDGERAVQTPTGGSITIRSAPAPAKAVRLTELDWAANDAGSLTVGELDPGRKCDLVDCATVNDDQTMLEVAAASALRADAVLADLSSSLPDWAIGPFSYLLFRAEDLPLTSADLDDLIANGLGLQGDGSNRVTYQLHYVREGDADASAVEARLVLNHNATPLAGTGTLSIDGGAPAALDPTAHRLDDGRIELTWSTATIPAGSTATFSIVADPGPREGHYLASGSLDAFSGTEPFRVEANDTALLRVTPNFEANDALSDLDARHVVAPGQVAVNQLSHATDVDLFRIPVEGREGVLVITNSQKEAPAIVTVYYPAAADIPPPQRAPAGELAQHLRLRDRGLSVRPSEGEDVPSSPPELPDVGLVVADFSANPGSFQDIITVPVPTLRPAQPGDPEWARDVIVAVTPAPGGPAKAGTSLLAARVFDGVRGAVAGIPESACAGESHSPVDLGYTWPAALASDVDTVYLLNASALHRDDPTGFARLQDELELLAGHPRLGRFAVLALDSHPDWQAAAAARDADPCSLEASNALARVTSDLLDGLDPENRLADVAINVLGAHSSIPMSWLPDFAHLSVGNEIVYASDYAHSGGDADVAHGLARGHYPSDAPLASTDVVRLGGAYLYDQDRVLARTVGSASEIADAIAHLRANNGEFVLDDATVASTDAFMDFLGDVVTSDLAAAGVEVERLREVWTGTDLRTALAAGRDLVAQNVHGSAEVIVAADGERLRAADLRAAAPPDGPATSVFAGIDCHVGLGGEALDSILDGLGDLAANSAINTTYGYGLDGALALHGRTHALFVGNLLEGHPAARAWTEARQESILADPQFGSLAEKAYASATFFGLTGWRVAGSTPPDDAPATQPTSTDPISGLSKADFDRTLVPGVDLVERSNDDGTFWTGPGGAVTFASGEPIQPAASWPVALDGEVAGALITGLETVVAATDVDLAHATTELAGGVGSHYENQAPFDDSGLLTVRRRGAATALALKAGFATGFHPVGGNLVADQHLVTGLNAELFASPPGTAPEPAPPIRHRVTEITRSDLGSSVAFVADFDADRPAVRVVGAVLGSDGAWYFAELASAGTLGFTGLVVLPDGVRPVLAFLQTVSPTGAVFQTPMVEPAPDVGSTPGLTVHITGDRGPTGAYIDPLVELVPANPAALVRFGINGAALQDYTGAFRLTGPEQLHCITVEVSDLDQPHEFCVVTEGRPGDPGTPPEVHLTSPLDGAQVKLGSVVEVLFSCRDANGVAAQSGQVRRDGQPVGPTYSGDDGQALVTDDVGAHVLQITCTDQNGNTRHLDVRYRVVFDTLGGFLSPIQNPPAVNQATAGQAVKVQFRLTDAAGQYVARDGDVLGMRSYETAAGNCLPAQCPNIHHEGNSTIRYEDGKVLANWQTEERWRGSSRTLVITLRDGTILTALFKFKS